MIQISVQKVSGCRKDSQEVSGVVMENGPKDPLFEVQVSEHTKNGAVSTVMAKFPDWNIPINQENTTEHSKAANINGDDINFVINEENSLSSESDALVIDESVNKIQKNNKKPDQKLTFNPEEISNNCSETVTHSNPFFNESLFELTQLHQNNQEDAISSSGNKFEKNIKKYKKKLKPKHQITEYAQYLGLQPSVQFKCPKCSRTGFDTLPILQEHVAQCNEENVQDIIQNRSSSGFKLTRKVFLCSACGTYYENWNLYIHMLEFHKRYICLYCLGMFSLLEDLCQHIQSKHNLQPGYKNTLDEFFSVYNEPCYIACCECDKLFSEQDNFFYHNCVGKNKPKKLPVKQQITPENHVTGESETNIEKVEPEVTKEQITDIMDSGVTQVVENAEPSIINGKHLTESNNDETEMSIEKEESSLSNGANNTESQSPKESICPLSENMDDNKEDFEENQSFEDSIKQENTETSTDNCDISNNKSDYQNNINEHQADYNNSMRKDDQEVLDESEETRKVPKLSLKLPKLDSYEPEPEDSDDSEKLTMEVDQVESDDNENENELETKTNNEEQSTEEIKAESQENEMQSSKKQENHLQVAGPDIPVIELQLEQPLDKFDPRILLQKCLKMTVPTCIYCNHARKIAVNGKQLGLHCIAEHRFSAIVNSITAEELIPQNFVNRISECLDELSSVFFNLESSFSNEAITFSHLFECFQCHFSTTVHKELYLHNRKYHSKNMLLCIMCKSNFYSYSELICHLCPGLYVLDYELTFKCCMCVHDDLPSSFRLMVHLRTKHNVCDVCLDSCHTQHRLSNHVWKHKLHHFCYRCGIAYRNKPDITRHLFWKHGTESVLCKKCLQKKWPHVYHFCIPPSSFGCDECGLTFSRAVYLKVHKRLHTNEYKHACTFEGCEEKFISKKLLATHERKHFEPSEEPKTEEVEPNKDEVKEEVDRNDQELLKEDEKNGEKPKPKIDVLEDLPALNLSESDSSSESETEANPPIKKQDSVEPKQETLNPETELEPPGELPPLDILQEHKSAIETPEENTSIVMQGIWDNFKNYQEKQHKLDIMFNDQEKTDNSEISVVESEKPDKYLVLSEHNYCASPDEITKDTTLVEVKLALTESVDHDYCFSKPEGSGKEEEPTVEQPITAVKDDKKEATKTTKNSSSSSSSDSDSSSCSCGSNCSCSSSSGSSCSSSDSSSSDSSSEEGRKRQLLKKEKRKERAKKLKEEQEKANKVDIVSDAVPIVIETPIRESDLETTESETDEEFYDEAPQKLAKKILEEKRQQLLELMGPNNIPNGSFIESTSRPPTPPSEVIEPEEKKKKKSKSKKKKKRKSEKKLAEYSEPIVNNIISPDIPIPPYYQQFHQQQQLQPQTPSVAPITLTISRNSPVSSPLPSVSTPVSLAPYSKVQTEPTFSKQDSVEKNLRASKRRRVPNKFYGYSSEEEVDKPVSKQRKTESSQTPRSPMVVPPITIKTPTPTPPQPPIEPISIRTGTHLSDFRVQRPRPKPSIPPIRLLSSRGLGDGDSESDSNDSSSDEQTTVTPKPAQPQLYCYCRCPYDEVSEMIGCDATDCEIEWFHFECVGIMVPPKGQWFCPDCRKKKTRREIMQQHMKNN